MADKRVALREFAKKHSDCSFLRELGQYILRRDMMASED